MKNLHTFMKITHFLLALSLVSLTACSSTTAPRDRRHLPETMLITYHVKPGKEAELQEVISRAWGIYRQNKMVFAKPHTIVQDKEDGDKTRIIEIFTWVSASAPDHAPDAVQKVWGQMQSLCESRDGRGGLELDAVDLLVPKK
jgi:hypothetical protein